MPRALSSSKLEEQNVEAVPAAAAGGANNPFLQADGGGGNYSYTADGRRIEANQGGQYYGAGYSQAQSSYSSSGFGRDSPLI